MILVDTSVWIDFLHAKPTPQTDMLKRVRRSHRLGTPDLVLAEILQGSRTERTAEATRQMLCALQVVVVSDEAVAVEAARHYRLLRTLGITPRKTIDTLIATRCILDGHALLYADRDFDPFVQHLGLRSAMDLPTGAN